MREMGFCLKWRASPSPLLKSPQKAPGDGHSQQCWLLGPISWMPDLEGDSLKSTVSGSSGPCASRGRTWAEATPVAPLLPSDTALALHPRQILPWAWSRAAPTSPPFNTNCHFTSVPGQLRENMWWSRIWISVRLFENLLTRAENKVYMFRL